MKIDLSFPQTALRLRIWPVVLLLPLLCCAAFGMTRAWNDARINTLAAHLSAVPLPPQTERLSQTVHIGALVGLHDHCDYAVEQVLATQLSAEDVVRFYKDATIPSVGMTSTRLPINAIVDRQRLPDGRLRVTLRVIDPDQPQGLELRCH